MNTDRRWFAARVAQLAQGTPYVVRETPSGFDMTIDIVDTRWRARRGKHGRQETFTFHVAFDDAKHSFSITDEQYGLVWKAGPDGRLVPILGAGTSMRRGTIHLKWSRRVYGRDQQGRFGEVAHYTFDSEEGRAFIKQAAAEGQWQQRMGMATKVGLWAAISALVLLAVAGIVVLVR